MRLRASSNSARNASSGSRLTVLKDGGYASTVEMRNEYMLNEDISLSTYQIRERGRLLALFPRDGLSPSSLGRFCCF